MEALLTAIALWLSINFPLPGEPELSWHQIRVRSGNDRAAE